jgi:hypothetical protein
MEKRMLKITSGKLRDLQLGDIFQFRRNKGSLLYKVANPSKGSYVAIGALVEGEPYVFSQYSSEMKSNLDSPVKLYQSY